MTRAYKSQLESMIYGHALSPMIYAAAELGIADQLASSPLTSGYQGRRRWIAVQRGVSTALAKK